MRVSILCVSLLLASVLVSGKTVPVKSGDRTFQVPVFVCGTNELAPGKDTITPTSLKPGEELVEAIPAIYVCEPPHTVKSKLMWPFRLFRRR
jgi:hypothetical protein